MDGVEQMTINERRTYLKRMRGRYQQADRTAKGALLDEMSVVTGLHRKRLERQPRRRRRGRTYGRKWSRWVVRVWQSLDFVCAKRLIPRLLETTRQLAKFGELQLTLPVEAQLGQISEVSVTRLLARHRSERLRLPRPGSERADSQNKGVPMKRIAWDTREPGQCEVDLLQHGEPASPVNTPTPCN